MEPNAGPQTATPIELGHLITAFGGGGDYNYFSFNVDEDCMIRITVNDFKTMIDNGKDFYFVGSDGKSKYFQTFNFVLGQNGAYFIDYEITAGMNYFYAYNSAFEENLKYAFTIEKIETPTTSEKTTTEATTEATTVATTLATTALTTTATEQVVVTTTEATTVAAVVTEATTKVATTTTRANAAETGKSSDTGDAIVLVIMIVLLSGAVLFATSKKRQKS